VTDAEHGGLDALRVLNARQVRDLLPWPELIDVSRNALIALATPGGVPPGSSTQVAVPGASLHLKAGALLEPPILSVKANLRPDQGSSSGAILAFDHRTQRLEAILASADLTAMRTGAIAAVAADCLHPGRSPVVALIGAGPVATMALRALQCVLTPASVRVWSRDSRNADLLAARDRAVAVASVAGAVRGADLVLTCTPARTPLLHPQDLADRAVVLALGADSPGKRELGPGVLDDAQVFVDVRIDALAVGECAHLAGESAGVVLLGEQLSQPRALDGRRVVFDSVGSPVVDAAAVSLVLESARALDVGTRLDLG